MRLHFNSSREKSKMLPGKLLRELLRLQSSICREIKPMHNRQQLHVPMRPHRSTYRGTEPMLRGMQQEEPTTVHKDPPRNI